MLNRRTALGALGAWSVSSLAARAKAAGPVFDYVLLDGDGASLEQSLRQAGAAILGRFAPQLGWSSRQSAVLIGWETEERRAGAKPAPIFDNLGSAANHSLLRPTARPTSLAAPPKGGIYVHRWFAVPGAAIPEFVALSVEGWADFEARFATKIYGLFLADETPADRTAGERRLLLLTQYRDHGVWETSRDPTTDAMAAFRRRRALTKVTWAASSLLVTAP